MSLLSLQDQNRQNAMTGYNNLSQLESNRDNYNNQAESQQRAKAGSAIGSGIAIGMATGNPFVGAGVALMGVLL